MCKENARKWVRKSSEMGRQNIRNVLWSVRKIQVRMRHTIIEACARTTSGNGCGKHHEWVINTSEMGSGLEGNSRYG
jgi:hypothetical protein